MASECFYAISELTVRSCEGQWGGFLKCQVMRFPLPDLYPHSTLLHAGHSGLLCPKPKISSFSLVITVSS